MSKSMRANSLAQMLDSAKRQPGMTGVWSRLQEEVGRWAERYPRPLQDRYSLYRAAYRDLKNNPDNEAAQRAMVAAADAVSATLRQLGNITIEVCDRRIVGSIDPCNFTLTPAGLCPNAVNHR